MTCAKCGSNNTPHRIDDAKNTWLCDKCYKKWDKLIESNWDSDERWHSNFEEMWDEYWNKFLVGDKEKVMFT